MSTKRTRENDNWLGWLFILILFSCGCLFYKKHQDAIAACKKHGTATNECYEILK